MSELDIMFETAEFAPTFVCVACLLFGAMKESTCAGCGNRMRSMGDSEVSEFVLGEAQRRVHVILKRQITHGSFVCLPLWFYLLLLTTVGQTLTWLLPGFLLIAIVAVHPYVFKRDARIARKYRVKPKDLAESFDVLETKMQ